MNEYIYLSATDFSISTSSAEPSSYTAMVLIPASFAPFMPSIISSKTILGSNIKLWDIYLFYVVPVFIATVILLYFGSRIAVKRAVRSMINQNIIEKLNTVE